MWGVGRDEVLFNVCEEVLSLVLLRKKYCVSMRVLNSLQHLYVFCLKVLVEVGTNDKPLLRTEDSSSVNV